MAKFDIDLVGKVGSLALIDKAYGDINYSTIARISRELRPGMIWITSGATEIGRLDFIKRTGRELTGSDEDNKTDYSAQGQSVLMGWYRQFVDSRFSLRQILVEHQHFNDAEKREYLKKVLLRCPEEDAIPIINYNDAVCYEENRKMEIRALMNEKKRAVECVDNDETASQVACLVNAKHGRAFEKYRRVQKVLPRRIQKGRKRSGREAGIHQSPRRKRHGSHHCQQQVFNPRYSGRKRPRNPHKSKITIQNAAIKRRLCKKKDMYKVFKSYELDNPSQYDWFRKFSNPCYGMNVKVDVTEVVKTSKESGTSFFANVLFLLTTALNSVPEMRMREVKNEIRLYDVINPTFTVMTDSGKFVNAGFKMTNDYKEFYDTTRRIIDEKKKQTTFTAKYNDSSDYDDYYMTCLPWISVESLMHPLPDNNIESSSCPRIGWDKYREENGRYVMTLNVTVNHCFVDGKRLSDAFAAIQRNFDNAATLLR